MNKLKLKIRGMHCTACEILLERKFSKINGVAQVKVNQAKGEAVIHCSRVPSLNEFQAAISNTDYRIENNIGENSNPFVREKTNYIELGLIFFIVIVAYLMLKELKLMPNVGISENMGYGLVFVIGLVAAMSTCMAVTGGLLLAIAAKYSEQHPNLSGWQKFKPNLYFNFGRVISYTVLGGLIGALGSVLTISARINGLISILASVVMLALGLQMLKLFPWLARFQPKIPKIFGHKIHDLGNKESKAGPFIMGVSTFFLPCGFTQALQLYVLSRGSWQIGALTMLVFSLGNLPALLSLSVLSSFIKGNLQNYFIKFAGVIVVLLGIFNIQNGFNLIGINTNVVAVIQESNQSAQKQDETNVILKDGKQIAEMTIEGLTYTPSRFKVIQDVPVEFRVDGRQAAGCGQVIIFPKLGLTKFLLKDQITVIEFTPEELGEITFNCPMGMMTQGAGFTVIANDKGIIGAQPKSAPVNESGFIDNGPVDPEAQQLQMEVTREKGFYPNVFTLKKGKSVQLNIDVKLELGGCMSTLLVPDYNIAHAMKLGQSNFKFTPTKTGTVYFTCSMGSKLGYFTVTD